MADPGFEPPDGWDPTSSLIRGLAAEAAGEPYDEDEMQLAACTVVALNLVARGVDEARAMRMVEQALDHGDIRITYSAAEGLSVTIGGDGEATSADAQVVRFGREHADG